MRPPPKIKIKNRYWQVKMSKTIRSGKVYCDGLCVFGGKNKRRDIYIRKGMSKERAKFVFLHELVHAVIFEYGIAPKLNPKKLKTLKDFEKVEEDICDAVAEEFLRLFEISIGE